MPRFADVTVRRVETLSPAGRPLRRSASFIGGLTLAGRVLERLGAFGQILLIAAFFGATTNADLYFIASIVPFTLGGIGGEALHVSVLPLLARRDDVAVHEIMRAGLWVSATLLGIATLAYVAVAAVVVSVAHPAGTDDLGPWLAFAPIGLFLGLGAYLAAVLLRLERYVWPPFRSAAATLVGLGLSAAALALSDSVVWVALAVSAGYGVALLLLIVEVAAAAGTGVFGVPSRTALRELLGLRRRLLTSLLGGILGGQVFVFIERALAASLGVGAVSAISYGRGVAFTPGVMAQSIALGLYPGMLRAHAERRFDHLRNNFVAGLRITLFVALGTAEFVALYSGSVTGLLFGHGKLTSTSLLEVDRSLAAFSVAVVGTMLMIFTSRVFNAIDHFRGIVLSQSLALALYVPLALLLRPPLGPAGLALAFGIGELVGGLFGVGVTARRIGVEMREIARRVVLPAGARAGLLLGALASFRYGVAPKSELAEVAGGLALGVGVAVALLWRSAWPELEGLRRFARRLSLR